MPFTATVLRLMIASPGDVQAERSIVREVVGEWNSTNGAHANVMLLAVGWETDVAPEMGDAPQKIIDKRILANADLLVGMFWTRLGTPTASYASGAVEEIEEHLKAGKPAMLYFSSAPAPLDSVDAGQYQALKTFRDSCKPRGLFSTYSDAEDFRRKFSRDLQITMNSSPVAPSGAAPKSDAASGSLSSDAAALLATASADASGMIMFERFGGGAEISAGDRVFNADSAPRTIARWEGAIRELETRGLVRATSSSREVFEVTRDGYAAADALSKAPT
jgi:hypothetical protein